MNKPYHDLCAQITDILCVKFHGAVNLIPRVSVIGNINSMAPCFFNKSVEFVHLLVENTPRHRAIAVLAYN